MTIGDKIFVVRSYQSGIRTRMRRKNCKDDMWKLLPVDGHEWNFQNYDYCCSINGHYYDGTPPYQKKYLDVLEAYRDGKGIEIRLNNGRWNTTGPNLDFNFAEFDYRVKGNAPYEIMEHFAKGGNVEVKPKGYTSWKPIEEPAWNFKDFDYRIAPVKENKQLLEWAEIMRAHENGEVIERKEPNKDWGLDKNPLWNWSLYDYRVAQNPPVPQDGEWHEVKYARWIDGRYEVK